VFQLVSFEDDTTLPCNWQVTQLDSLLCVSRQYLEDEESSIYKRYKHFQRNITVSFPTLFIDRISFLKDRR
jgi:hypothetical protein